MPSSTVQSITSKSLNKSFTRHRRIKHKKIIKTVLNKKAFKYDQFKDVYSKDDILIKDTSKSFKNKIKRLKKVLPKHRVNNYKTTPIEDFDYRCLLEEDKIKVFFKKPLKERVGRSRWI